MPFIKFTNTCIIIFFSILSSASASSEDNVALNQFYTQFTQAFETLDAQKVKNIYAEDACYIPESQSKEITMGRDNIIKVYHDFFGKIKHKEAQIEVDFRVLDRQVENNNATDIGYYLIRFHPSLDAEEPISEFAGKFVIVSKKKKDGKWYLTVDTNNRSEPSFYYDAKPIPNLYYGHHFSPLTTAKNDN
ncbi:nuclear transport factor 2 family protein [Shewanella sp. D64]|uniref:YybH family protein n=1 Tax=unclassified Shewanella TaxID=196818 RepID=UPI0022BA3D73|nr:MULTISPECIES: nuclear transport factor 2 family protein [unclassified Shewanella]MEC4725249.1 nuclear transport factor 2 family protein [Shewanella sp. D64]MEC4735905.1 nuclear transport factor 2 family protein [Shewanella sp. E94]WBJ93127.1 nuclear transport factor 2 family protein [Shewanella sp. MTB7]